MGYYLITLFFLALLVQNIRGIKVRKHVLSNCIIFSISCKMFHYEFKRTKNRVKSKSTVKRIPTNGKYKHEDAVISLIEGA